MSIVCLSYSKYPDGFVLAVTDGTVRLVVGWRWLGRGCKVIRAVVQIIGDHGLRSVCAGKGAGLIRGRG